MKEDLPEETEKDSFRVIQLKQYNDFLSKQEINFNSEISEKQSALDEINSDQDFSEQKMNDQVIEYKKEKANLENFTKKLIQKFESVLHKASTSLTTLQKSMASYEELLETKKVAMVVNSEKYYNLKNLFSSKIPKQLEDTINAHQKYLEDEGKILV